jgi:peptide/nickel transport system permease protein
MSCAAWAVAVVMVLVATIVLVIAHVIPGDPAAVILGPSATAVDGAALRTQLGLDAPLLSNTGHSSDPRSNCA